MTLSSQSDSQTAPATDSAGPLPQEGAPRLVWALELTITLFAAWTAAYHLCLLAAFPAYAVWLVWLPPAFAGVWLLRSHGAGAPVARRQAREFAASLSILVIFTATMALATFNPNLDDISFFHRPLAQASALRLPFILRDTALDPPGLPPLSMLHCLTSYEHLCVLTSCFTGLDPLWTYQYLGGAVAAVLFVLVTAATLREFGVSPRAALAATGGVLLFLLLDGNLHRSWGTVSLVRFWQAKCILWCVLLPCLFLLAYRFTCRPSLHRWLPLAFGGVAAIGLSGSATFLIPALVAAIAVTHVAAQRFRVRAWAAAAALVASAAYPLAIGAAFALHIIPQPDMAVWNDWPQQWWANVYALMIGDPWSLARDWFLLLVVPVAMLRGRARWFVPGVTLAMLLLFLNPVTGPRVLHTVTPASYWRLYYLLPMPLCAGLAVLGLELPWRGWRDALGVSAAGVVVALFALALRLGWRGAIRFSVAGVAMALTALAFKSSSLAEVPLAWPTKPKLPIPEVAISRLTIPHLAPGDIVLAPENVFFTLALLDPQVRFAAVRHAETIHYFQSAGLPEEGRRRDQAESFVEDDKVNQQNEESFRTLLASRHLRAIVVCEPAVPNVQRVLDERMIRWTRAESTDKYVLILLEPGAGGPP